MKIYFIATALLIYCGSFISVPLVWAVMDLILALVAVPNAIALVVLAYKFPKWLKE